MKFVQKKIYGSLFTMAAVCLGINLEAGHGHPVKNCQVHEESTQQLARCLVTKFWDDVVAEDLAGYSSLLARGFQGLNLEGHYNRADQIEGLEGLTVSKYKLNNLIAARYHETLVVSYDFVAKGQNVTSGPSIDIWHKTKSKWKLISHSYVPFQS